MKRINQSELYKEYSERLPHSVQKKPPEIVQVDSQESYSPLYGISWYTGIAHNPNEIIILTHEDIVALARTILKEIEPSPSDLILKKLESIEQKLPSKESDEK